MNSKYEKFADIDSVCHCFQKKVVKGKKNVAHDNMISVNFKMKSSEYAKLIEIVEGLGFTPDTGIRFALSEFLRRHSER